MVRHGMKVGDTFEDGGLTYQVLAVNGDCTYTSKRVEKPVEKAVKEDVTPKKPTVKTTSRKK